mmetsp:Transcript_40651/g.107505  ORF Transcript_40651/g.107505 Transcript_40651/m.107505 type:complete len:146 (-) Transcript_40651:764-1201(-)
MRQARQKVRHPYVQCDAPWQARRHFSSPSPAAQREARTLQAIVFPMPSHVAAAANQYCPWIWLREGSRDSAMGSTPERPERLGDWTYGTVLEKRGDMAIGAAPIAAALMGIDARTSRRGAGAGASIGGSGAGGAGSSLEGDEDCA